MFIALRELRIPNGKGGLDLVKPEQKIDLSSCDEPVRRALLNLEWVRLDESAPVIEQPVEQKKKKKSGKA